MKKDSIIQFVGFITQLEPEDFYSDWERYCKEFSMVPASTVLQHETSTASRFKYVSQHELRDPGLSFTFMKGRNTRLMPEQKIKVVQAGGYLPVQIGCKHYSRDLNVKIMAFLSHNEYDLDYYKELSGNNRLNIYQAYYENCMYGYIFEYFSPENDVPELLEKLKTRNGIELGIYCECILSKSHA